MTAHSEDPPTLLPCPFCGGPAHLTGPVSFDTYDVVCGSLKHPMAFLRGPRDVVIKAWNRRAVPVEPRDTTRLDWLAKKGIAQLDEDPFPSGSPLLGRSYYAGEVTLREAIDAAMRSSTPEVMSTEAPKAAASVSESAGALVAPRGGFNLADIQQAYHSGAKDVWLNARLHGFERITAELIDRSTDAYVKSIAVPAPSLTPHVEAEPRKD